MKKRNQMLLSGVILIATLVCAFFGWDHDSRHSSAWNHAFYGLLLLNSIYIYFTRDQDKPVPDTLIKLFPKPIETPGKTKTQ